MDREIKPEWTDMFFLMVALGLIGEPDKVEDLLSKVNKVTMETKVGDIKNE